MIGHVTPSFFLAFDFACLNEPSFFFSFFLAFCFCHFWDTFSDSCWDTFSDSFLVLILLFFWFFFWFFLWACLVQPVTRKKLKNTRKISKEKQTADHKLSYFLFKIRHPTCDNFWFKKTQKNNNQKKTTKKKQNEVRWHSQTINTNDVTQPLGIVRPPNFKAKPKARVR